MARRYIDVQMSLPFYMVPSCTGCLEVHLGRNWYMVSLSWEFEQWPWRMDLLNFHLCCLYTCTVAYLIWHHWFSPMYWLCIVATN